MRILIYIILIVFSSHWVTRAQSLPSERFYNRALNYKKKNDTNQAFKNIIKAINENPLFVEAYTTLGKWYEEAELYQLAAQIYKSAGYYCKSQRDAFYTLAAKNYFLAQLADSALIYTQKSSKNDIPNQQINQQARRMLNLESKNVHDTSQAHKLSFRINSKDSELFPSYSVNKERIYFTRRINGVNEDFYTSTIDSCGDWFYAHNMGYPPNTAAQESAMNISYDDHYLFFMRSDNRSENGWGRGGYDLYIAYRKSMDSAWSAEESFGATINTPAFEGMPSVSTDVNDMYFVSNRAGGYGGHDIWVTHFQNGLWQMPINLGPQINTAGNETSPFICADNNTLIFASDNHPGLGKNDLFISKRINDTTWSKPQNLGVPINSPFDDISLFVSPDGESTLFASDRDQSGNLDIFETKLPNRFRVPKTTFALCYIIDSIAQVVAPLSNLTLYDSLGNTIAQYHANKGDGSIVFSMPIGKTYFYTARAFGYQPNEGSIYFSELCPKWCNISFSLLPRGYVKPSKDSLLLTFNYDKNIIALNDSQKIQINDAIKNISTLPDLSFLVNSYTDNTGTPIINTEKATLRANDVAAAIQNTGISNDKIIINSFGDANPIAPNDSPENQYINRRVEIVIRWSY